MLIKKAIVTGGAGFIGSHIVDELLVRGSTVVVYDNFCTGRREYLPKPQEGRLTVVEGDVLDMDRLTTAMAGCDFAFHWQANADVRGGQANTRVDLEQNTLATWNVLDAMRKNEVKGLAFASSSAVYGEPEIFPTPESYAPTQTSLYGASKLAGEAMIEAYCEYFGMRSFMFRFVSWIGERYSHGVIFDFMKKLQQDPTRLQVLGDGQQRKSYLYVRDGVSAIMLAIQKSVGNKNIYNIGHHDYINVVDLAKIVLQELGLKDLKMEFTGSKRGWIGDSPFVHLDTSKIAALGWKAKTSIEDGIRRTVQYLRQNQHIITERH
jgi:UDP-glucose 4-epimerase